MFDAQRSSASCAAATTRLAAARCTATRRDRAPPHDRLSAGAPGTHAAEAVHTAPTQQPPAEAASAQKAAIAAGKVVGHAADWMSISPTYCRYTRVTINKSPLRDVDSLVTVRCDHGWTVSQSGVRCTYRAYGFGSRCPRLMISMGAESAVGSRAAFLTDHMQCVSRGRQLKLAAQMASVNAVWSKLWLSRDEPGGARHASACRELMHRIVLQLGWN
jgi:hypothetical protein